MNGLSPTVQFRTMAHENRFEAQNNRYGLCGPVAYPNGLLFYRHIIVILFSLCAIFGPTIEYYQQDPGIEKTYE